MIFLLSFYNMSDTSNIHNTDVEKIKNEVNDLLELLNTNVCKSENVLQKRFSYLFTTSPTLFKFIIKNHNGNKTNLYKNIDMMLSLIKNIQTSKISQYDASAIVGQKIGEQYIPQLKKEES